MFMSKNQFSISFIALVLAAPSFAAAASAPPPRRAIAICSDVRSATDNPPLHYSGQELITQEGDAITVQYLPDRLSGFAGASISYERVTNQDAAEFGFKISEGLALYMLHGDEELPSEYVILPAHMAEISIGRFQALYGTCDETGQYDAASSTRMNCALK